MLFKWGSGTGTNLSALREFFFGSTTRGVTISADVDVGSGFGIFGSATGAQSVNGSDQARMRLQGVYGSAWQAGVSKRLNVRFEDVADDGSFREQRRAAA